MNVAAEDEERDDDTDGDFLPGGSIASRVPRRRRRPHTVDEFIPVLIKPIESQNLDRVPSNKACYWAASSESH